MSGDIMTTGTERAPRSRLRLELSCLVAAISREPIARLSRLLGRFRRDAAGTILPTFALTMIPVMTAVGAAVDYSRANNVRSKLQTALDTAVLAGAKSGSSNWIQLATNVFEANVTQAVKNGVTVSKNFAQ